VTHAGWLSISLATILAAGCGGSLRPAILLASARAQYPDCDDIAIAERADGVQQWMVLCGERRLFGLRSESDLARDRQAAGEGDAPDAILRDRSGPIRWGDPRRVDEPSASSVAARLRPLAVEVTMLGIGAESSYFTVVSPHHPSCTARPELLVDGQPLELGSAPTETVIDSRHRFARRVDLATLRVLASEEFEISYCGERHALDDEAAVAFRRWAADRVESNEIAPVPTPPSSYRGEGGE
jgi:hypothetical protein